MTVTDLSLRSGPQRLLSPVGAPVDAPTVLQAQ